MWDEKLGTKITISDGVDCPYKDKCAVGKTQIGICEYYWLSKIAKPS
jgi:hypothetical protein